MKKEVISIFLFSLFLFACAPKMIPPPAPLPEPVSESPIQPVDRQQTLWSDPSDTGVSFGEWRNEPERSAISQDENKNVEENLTKDLSATAPGLEEAGSPAGPVLPLPIAPPGTPVKSISLPDLAITNLWLTPQRRLTVTMANIGEGPLPTEVVVKLKIYVDDQLKGIYRLDTLPEPLFLLPKENFNFTTPLTIFGRHEVQAFLEIDQGIQERDSENIRLKKVLEGLPIGPDILIKDLDLTEDLDLIIVLSNGGETDLRRGTTLRVRIDVDNRKISEFDHFISEPLKANFGNRYVIDPPYAVKISESSKVKVLISPKSSFDDIRLINNTLKRNFVLFPFKIEAQGRQEFSFSLSSSRPGETGPVKKLKAELRWEGGAAPLMLSFGGLSPTKGKTPLKVEVPIRIEPARKKKVWRVVITSFSEKRVEGHLIFQHP